MKKLFQFLCLAASLSVAAISSAQTIISDDLNGSYNSIWGTTPETTLPGGNWTQATGWYFHGTEVPNSEAGGYGVTMNNGAGAGISLASSGGYTKPSSLTISSKLAIFTGANNHYGNVGFYDELEASTGSLGPGPTYLNSLSNFSGISVGYDGSLSLYNDGSLVGTSVAYAGGTFALDTMLTLTYTVNTSTGALSGLTFQGSSADYSSILANGTFFNDALTAYAGFGAANDASNQGGVRFRDFSVEVAAVPEPSTYALLLGGLGLVLFLRCRRPAFV